MARVWEVQQKHLPCIQDPAGVQLYTKAGSSEKGGKTLDVLRCARGSSSLESLHRHQCSFIPGKLCFTYSTFITHTYNELIEVKKETSHLLLVILLSF